MAHGPMIVVLGRQHGKTEALLQWLAEGKPVNGSPGWSRVLLCLTRASVYSMLRRVAALPVPAGVDLRRCIVSVEDAAELRGSAATEMGVDDAEMVLQFLLRVPQLIKYVTMTGELAA